MMTDIQNNSLSINEIFNSIQGEGLYSGQPCTFIRLTGCNLRCTWCDTKYAYTNGKKMSTQNIIQTVLEYNCNLIEITGGEPLLQEEVFSLINDLHNYRKKILIETNGSLPILNIPHFVHVIMDIKPPSSNGFSKQSIENIKFLKKTDEIKIIIEKHDDFVWANQLISKLNLFNKLNNPIILQPVFGVLQERELASWILESKNKYKLGIQLHKYIYDENMMGV
jgi:7-carboxy-7-deazaguanine synthase